MTYLKVIPIPQTFSWFQLMLFIIINKILKIIILLINHKMSSLVRKQTLSLKRDVSSSSMNYSSLGNTEAKQKNKQQIEALLQKFNEINGQVELDLNQGHFNLINYERQNQKAKYDPQLMAAKLRKLQNRAEINRAQRQFENRQKKKNKKTLLQKPKQKIENYKTIYKNFLLNNKLSEQFQQFSDDETDENKSNPKGLAYFSQLKRHPLLLEYTLEKINSKQKVDELKMKKLENTLTNMKKTNSQVSPQYKDLLDEYNKKLLNLGDNNPENIIQVRFSKFYTKKSSDKLSKQIKSIPRCSKMIQKQNEILSQIEDRSISKENRQKLKSRLNEIINSISKSEKLNSIILPRLHQTQRAPQKNEKKE